MAANDYLGVPQVRTIAAGCARGVTMSVLYKALQKAAKENEQRQAAGAPTFDPERLAGSGVIRAGASRTKWRVAALLFLVVAAAAMGAAYYLTEIAPSSAPQVALAPPPRPAPSGPPSTVPVPVAPAPQAPPAGTAAPQASPPPAAAPAAAPPAPQAVAQAPAEPQPRPPAAAPVPPRPAAPEAAPPAAAVAAAPESAPAAVSAKAAARAEAAKPAPAKAVSTREPMPTLAADSPARMLDPPISIRRSQIDLEGVGNAVRVRTVSKAAQDTVGSAYNALIRGEYDTALGFYEQALKQEPRSVLALLGRGTALQKLGRKDEARASYEQVLKIDPANREALSNLTAIESDRAPGEALNRLMELEREYPGFSPIKGQIGMVYARLGDLEGALDYLRRALAIAPEATLFQYNLALVLDRMGRREQAVEAYDQVLLSMSGGRALPELSVADIQRRVSYLRAR